MEPDPNGHGFVPVDYKGARTAEAMTEFLKGKIGLTPETEQQLRQHDPSAAPAAAAAAPAAPAAPDTAHHAAAGVGDQESNAAAIARLKEAVQRINSMADNAEELAKQSLQDAKSVETGLKDVGADMPKEIHAVLPPPVKTLSIPLPLLSLSCLPMRKSSKSQYSQQASLQAPPAGSAQFL